MPISITCQCGKALRVKDEWAGLQAKCPGCGRTFQVPAPGKAGPTGAQLWAPRQRVQEKETLGSSISISPGIIALIAFIILVPLGVYLIKVGPIRAQHQWSAMESQADSDVSSVITLAIQAYLSNHSSFNPADPRRQPGVQAVTFEPSPVMLTLPEKVHFTGRASTGFFKGIYNTRSGEVIADVPCTQMLHVTGRVKSGAVTAEIDGEPAKLKFKPREPD